MNIDPAAFRSALETALGDRADLVDGVLVGSKSRLPCHPLWRSGESRSFGVVTVVSYTGLFRWNAPILRAALDEARAALGIPQADKVGGAMIEIVDRYPRR